jgi:hypothetical protein
MLPSSDCLKFGIWLAKVDILLTSILPFLFFVRLGIIAIL